MIHFIVSDPTCAESNSTGIWSYRKLMFTRCSPKMVEKVQQGLQGMSGNFVPIFKHTDWEKQADKLLTGK